nr:MAG TPA: hypothetical protein [Caudoviricetes sp.]
MGKGDFVINESLWVAIGKEDQDGRAKFRVFNGAWTGIVDFNKRTYWADRFPEEHKPITTIRPAVVGECEPYY